ncbi:MAG: hypothetical protein QW057_00345, partial [Candidatus Bathyarchaeia archaeon]
EPGKRADIIIVNLHKPHLTPVYNELSHLAYAAKCSDVETVLVDGRIAVENRRLTTVDVEEVMRRAVESKDRLVAKLRESTGVPVGQTVES